ncbi:MAG: DUF1631 domain-containing protein [Undibacterium sp.]|nr:DUF1631 domain-containing protein [Undibacterium sp.]
MDQTDLLSTARSEFLRVFSQAVQATFPLCIDELFKRADESYSSLEQGRLLDARQVLVEQVTSLVQQMTQTMDQLLARSFQTTYSTYRPSTNFSNESLTLIDPTAFEGGLRLEEITSRFRSEAEEQLRDLNIRIALVFEQEVTNERENPFRPYLFSRCFASTFENHQINPNLVDILIERFAGNFVSSVPSVYSAVNSHLAQNGIAAQLQLKIRKSPTQAIAASAEADESLGEAEESVSEPVQPRPITARGNSAGEGRPSQIEQFFSSAMNRAANLVGRRPAPTAHSDPAQRSNAPTGSAHEYSEEMNAASAAPQSQNAVFSWLKSGEAVGDAIRSFMGGGSGRGQAVDGNEVKHGQAQHKPQEPQGNGSSLKDDGDRVSQEFADYAPASGDGGASAGGVMNQYDAFGATAINSDNGGQTYTGNQKLPMSVHGFQRGHTPSGVDMFDANGGLRNLIIEQRSALNELASSVDEKMTIDIVAMLFEFILRDTQVPAEIRAQLGRLQFLVLKLALRDSSLLTQKGHPVRLLVNRIGSISLGLKQIDPSSVEITKEICRIVEALLQDESENSELFSLMLDEFDAFIARELRAVDKKIEGAIEGAEHARNRTLRFAHTAAQLHETFLGLTIDPFLQNFFETVWVYALEKADVENSKRAYRYRLLVPDLLWSIVPKMNEEERMQLLALLPIILSTLKEGLASIAIGEAKQDELMDWLVEAHTKAMRIHGSATLQKTLSLSTIHNHFSQFFANPDLKDFAPLQGKTGSDVKKFLEEAIKELDQQVQLLDQVYDATLPVEQTEAEEYSSDNTVDLVMEQLSAGVAVEINLGGEPSQGRLNWVDPALTNLILTLDGQERPSMVSVRMFRRMIAHGRVKFLEAEPLFERAVQSLLKSADTLEPIKS